MASKSQARRNKRQTDATEASSQPVKRDVTPVATKPTAKPTKERLARGNWTAPDSKGGGAYVESKSCLAVSSGGFDPSDGDEAVFKRYYAIRDKIGRVRTSMLQTECGKMAHETPHSVLALRESLDALDR